MTWGSWQDPKWQALMRAFQGDMRGMGLHPARLAPSLLSRRADVGARGPITVRTNVEFRGDAISVLARSMERQTGEPR